MAKVGKEVIDNKMALDDKGLVKDVRDAKVGVKDRIENKTKIDTKALVKDVRDNKTLKDIVDNRHKRPDGWPPIGGWGLPGGLGYGGFGYGGFGPTGDANAAADPFVGAASDGLTDPVGSAMVLLQQAIELLALATATGAAEPFIDASLRPDLAGGPASAGGAGAAGDPGKQLAEGDAEAKRQFDSPQG